MDLDIQGSPMTCRSFSLRIEASARAKFLYHHAMSAQGFLENDGQMSLDHTQACMDVLSRQFILDKGS